MKTRLKTSMATKAVVLPLSALLAGAGLVGCSNDTAGPEAGADVEDIQEEPAEEEPLTEEEPAEDEVLGFGEEFDDAQSFVGQTVTVSADVNEVLAPGVFTIAGTENTTIEPLRVVADPATDVEQDVAVQVTGTVMMFDPNDLSEIEGVLGDEFDESVFEDFEESEPFILATALSNDVGEPLEGE